MILSEAKKILAEILTPYSYEQFFETIVGQKPLALLGNNPIDRHMMLGDNPKKIILDAYEKFAPTLSSHIHTPVAPPPVARPVASAEAFQDLINDYHQRGYTVRIPKAANLSPRLALLIRALEMIFEKPGDVVVFWSGTDAKAPVHYDEIDVIAIQIHGTKRWFISDEPAPLPNKWKAPGEGQPSLGRYSTYDVQPGDLLYLPRGTAHTVHSTSESIHLSIGFVPVTLRDALNSVLDHLSELDRPFRADLGTRADDLAHRRNNEAIFKQIRDGLEKLVENCQSEKFIQASLAQWRARMIYDLPRLIPAKVQKPVTIDNRVKHTPLAIAQMVVTPDILDLRQPGEQILVHPGVADSLRYIIDTPDFRVADIPGEIGDEVRVALVSRLIQSGFLEVATS